MKPSRLFAPLLLLALAHPAQAGLFDDEEARQRIESMKQDFDTRAQQLDSRIQQLEATVPRNQLALSNQIDQLKQDLAALRGQIEVLTNDLDQAQKRQKDFYVDLDTRLRKFESPQSASAPAANQSAPAAAADPAAESHDYEAAINALRAGHFVDAAIGFRSFIKNYPKSSFLPGANFWAGNAHLQARDPATALDYFVKTYTTWPDDQLAPDAMLGAANAQEALKDKKGERATLEQLVAKYPKSDAGKTAKQRLKK